MSISKQSKERGHRIKAMFAMAQVSKTFLCEKYDISVHTLNAWISGSRLLSEKGADKLIHAFRQEGWFVSPEWLLSGKGFSPTAIDISYLRFLQHDVSITAARYKDEDFLIAKEVAFFRNTNPKAILLIVSNDSMEPHFSIGDYVGGMPIDPSGYDQVIGRVCIVDIENIERGLYIVHRGDKPEKYTFSVFNIQTKTAIPIIANVTPIKIAPIIWQRKSLNSIILLTT